MSTDRYLTEKAKARPKLSTGRIILMALLGGPLIGASFKLLFEGQYLSTVFGIAFCWFVFRKPVTILFHYLNARSAQKIAAAMAACHEKKMPLSELQALTGVRFPEKCILTGLQRGYLQNLTLEKSPDGFSKTVRDADLVDPSWLVGICKACGASTRYRSGDAPRCSYCGRPLE